MTPSAYCLFETAIGPCGLVWRGAVIVGAQLPEADLATARRRLLRRFHAAVETPPPAHVAAVIEAVRALLAEGVRDLADVPVDLTGLEPFERQVLEAARRIPPGRTRTYGQIAAELGQPRAAQAVGAALGRNPIPIIVPCHRVLAAGGKVGGFSAPGGATTKLKLLAIETPGSAMRRPSSEKGLASDEPTLF